MPNSPMKNGYKQNIFSSCNYNCGHYGVCGLRKLINYIYYTLTNFIHKKKRME